AAELGLAVNFAGSGAVADYRSVLERMVCLCLNRGDRDRPGRAEVFLGRSVAKAKHMSDETARIIDQEVKALIERNYNRARQILT
ncbi:hypothetical protein MJN76_32590, partial [Salmonella enterica subsp. enterica serovar Anatum]|nr:hypothetical protein [Salmonella enterica subsp. enterica serovar Anatum]